MSNESRVISVIAAYESLRDRGEAASVAGLCGGDAALESAVHDGLRRLGRVAAAFDTLPGPLASDSTAPDEGPLSGTAEALPVEAFAHYEILGRLGEGGMGLVLRARDTRLGREVALKVMRPEVAARPQAAKRFLREARSQALLRSPHVVPVYRADEAEGVPYLEMPLLRGEPLSARLAGGGVLSPEAAREVGRQAALGLAAAHEAGLIHRDIKPSNLWLEPGPGPVGTVMLLDFGLARASDAGNTLTLDGAISGTLLYMSPEQARGTPLDARSDLFSLGTVLYEATTGRRPFRGSGLGGLLLQVSTHTPPAPAEVNPAVPRGLSDLVMRLLAKNPEHRPASAAAAADEFARLGADGAAGPVLVAVPPELTAAAPVRRAGAFAAGVALALLAVGVAAWLVARDLEVLRGGDAKRDAQIQTPGG